MTVAQQFYDVFTTLEAARAALKEAKAKVT
jgi:hypothetical protein